MESLVRVIREHPRKFPLLRLSSHATSPEERLTRMMPRVLVVDDDTLYAEAATEILVQDGELEVVGRAADGREAVELALSLRPDVVVMDIHMPVMDGIEATRSLRRLLPSTRVVVVTSSPSASDRWGARGAGAHAFLTKELGSDALVEAALSAGLEAAAR